MVMNLNQTLSTKLLKCSLTNDVTLYPQVRGSGHTRLKSLCKVNMKIHGVHLVPCVGLDPGWSQARKNPKLPRLGWASLGGGTVHWGDMCTCGILIEGEGED